MTCYIRRKSDGKWYKRGKYYVAGKNWVDELKKATLFTSVGHARLSLYHTKETPYINYKVLRYNCENCGPYHACNKHKEMQKLLDKWIKVAIKNTFYFRYEVVEVELKVKS